MSPSNQERAGQAVISAIRAAYPIIHVITWEEERLEQLLGRAAGDRPLWRWSAAAGFTEGPGEKIDQTDPLAALQFVAREGRDAVVFMKDLPALLEADPALTRAVRDVYDALSGERGVLVTSHPDLGMPPALTKETFTVRLPLPTLEERLEDLSTVDGGADFANAEEWLEEVAAAMKGLSSNECRDLYRRLRSEGIEDVDEAKRVVRDVKARLLLEENCLEVVPVTDDLDQIGGLRALKKWIHSRHELFGHRAREAGIQPPSGLMLMGVSGCGKSLAAKIIPAAWDLPLIRLDMNLVMSSTWGSPEATWQRALRSAEAAAPVVLWIDEIENSFGYMDGKVAGGNMTIFSSFLTWMQEKPDDVFVVATANKIEMLPAEMLRKGRFDQLFFLDLPKEDARKEVLRIHIRKQGGDPEEFDIDHLAELVDGWTSAEIEQVVRAARLDAFYDEREFVYDDLMRNSFRMVPLSKTMSEQINALRGWCMKRAAPAD